MSYRYAFGIIALTVLVLATSCTSGPAPTPAVPTSAPSATAAPAQTKAPAVAPTTAPASPVPTQAVAPTAVPTVAPTKPPTTAATVAPTSAPTSAPTPTAPQPTTAAVAPTKAAAPSTPGTFGKADVDKIFPPGKGQDLVFQACTNCHNWVPIVLAGFDKGAWEQNKQNHRNRVSSLSDADFNYLYDYLEKTFPAGHPVPDNIPEDLLKEWTSY